ncbi:hypothetical protein [Nonomuraea sp. NPDC003754]
MSVRALRIAAGLETASLVILIVNLLTVHAKTITTFVGPVHGMCYVAVIGAVSLVPRASSGARRLACVPAVGGLLALRRLHSDVRHPAPGAQEG